MGRRLDGWRALSWRERGLLFSCALGLTALHATLALAGYKRTRRVVEALSRRRQSHRANSEELANARQLARLAAIAGRHGLVDATCLRQSLLVYGRLRRRGLDPRFQIGIKPADGPFQAHAWVELDGVRLLPGDVGHRAFLQPHRGLGAEADDRQRAEN